MVVANIDPLVALLYRAGGRLFFTRPVVALMAVVAVRRASALFGWQWWTGEQSVFLTDDSYAIGAAVLLGLNVHGAGLPRARPRAGDQARRPTGAGRPASSSTSASRRCSWTPPTCGWPVGGPGCCTTVAGPGRGPGPRRRVGASSGSRCPRPAPWCFKLSFAWYVNALFNLNPFLALDGYYLLMDWLEVPNLRARGLAWVAARLRRPATAVARRWTARVAWSRCTACSPSAGSSSPLNIAYRVYVDRVAGLIIGLWRSGWAARVLLVAVVAALLSPLVYVLVRLVAAAGAGWPQRGGASAASSATRRAGSTRCAPPACATCRRRRAGRPRRPGPLGAPAHR